ncbi:MAG: Ni/Fe-hydrogenase, b-type cytochrome subunit [Sporomusaceae bacterium]|nr:Ni/Fe-hydrogenase, b-type cytochrome subunit [Sporomusaceae bacterium]
MEERGRKPYYLFSPWLRIFHWTMVCCMPVLFLTGLYIGNPFFITSQGFEPTFVVGRFMSMETIRFVHFAAAYILLAALILRIYGFIINRGDRLLPRFWTRAYWEGFFDTLQHYLFLRRRHKPYLRNALARASYLGVYCLLLGELITGFTMYAMIRPNSMAAVVLAPLISLVSNEYWLHIIHHVIAWCFVLFAIVHVYMAARADLVENEGEISSMFTGYKYLSHTPMDAGEVTDEKDDHSGNRQHTA